MHFELSLPPSIREHRPCDYRRVCALVEGAFEDWRGRIGNDAFLAALDDILATESVSPGQILVAEQGDLLVGTVTYHASSADRNGLRPAGWSAAHRLAVAPEARGRGVGRHLLEACISRAREEQARMLCLYCPDSMPDAQALCAGLGFRHAPALDFRGRASDGRPAPVIAQALYLPLASTG